MQSLVRVLLVFLIIMVQTAGVGCGSKPEIASENTSAASVPPAGNGNQSKTLPPVSPVHEYTYRVINMFPHDTGAFTEGLVFDGGVLYESTGLKGQSSLRKVELETGKVLQMRPLGASYFGEGIALFGNTIIQLTWQEHKGFVYDKTSFEIKLIRQQ